VVYRKAHNHTKAYGTTAWFSVQALIDCAQAGPNSTALIQSKGCQGGWPLTAMDYIIRHGIPMETSYPYIGVNGNQCSAASKQVVKPLSGASALVAGDVKGMMRAVHENGAVVVVILFYLGSGSPGSYAGGVYNNPACVPGLSHAVTVVGYGTDPVGGDYWLVKNSFGQAWGEGGYLRIAKGINMCGIEDYPFAPVASK
jgi:C1A family cysteine protease